MASHHHYHHPYPTAAATNPTTPITTISYCYSCHPTPTPTPSPSPYPHPPPPNPHSTPPYTHYPRPHPHFCASHLTPPPCNPPTQCQCEHIHQNHHHFQEFKVTDQQTDRIVTSLLRRIAALESSLRRGSSSSVSHRSRQTLRDAAARTIQTHFRAFLARRSRTLRQLKQLASIKTTLNVLKSSVSGKTHFDTRAVSLRATDLLVKLDFIQGDDPLIRDGKRSISNELTRFMKVINGVTIISSRVVKNVRGGNKARVFSSDRNKEFDTNRNEAIDKFVASEKESEEEEEEEEDQQNTRLSDTGKSGFLRTRGGGLARSHGGVKPKQKKSVSFAENGDAYRVFYSTPEPASMGNVNEEESFDTEIELMKNLNKRVEKLGMASKDCEVDEEEDGGSSGSSDNEMDPRKDGYYERNVRDENDNEIENESFVFSAPLPVKMEGRAADHINRKKGVKIVDN